jgi:TPR repeat protein
VGIFSRKARPLPSYVGVPLENRFADIPWQEGLASAGISRSSLTFAEVVDNVRGMAPGYYGPHAPMLSVDTALLLAWPGHIALAFAEGSKVVVLTRDLSDAEVMKTRGGHIFLKFRHDTSDAWMFDALSADSAAGKRMAGILTALRSSGGTSTGLPVDKTAASEPPPTAVSPKASPRAADIEMMRTGAEQGNPVMMHAYGLWWMEQGDLTKAEHWWERAVSAGNAGAVYELGVLAEQRGQLDVAERWYRRSMDAGEQRAVYNLGLLLYKHLGAEDEGRAVISRAAELGDMNAMYAMGTFREDEGRIEEGLAWYKKAAEAGNLIAMNWLGNLAEQRGEPDLALSWWHRAADGGQENAMVSIAQHHVERDDLRGALPWSLRAAEAGYPLGMFFHSQILGLLGERTEVYRWMERAARAGHQEAIRIVGIDGP